MFPTEPVPERIGAYKIVRRAQGVGSAKVYVARKEGPMGFARLYTLKLVPNTAEGDTRFVEELTREAAICATLSHQAIQRMIDFFEHDKHLVLVLEHTEGTTLERLLSYLEQNKKSLSDGAKAYVGRELAAALVHAHAARDENGKPMPIVHRGLHPEYVLLGWDGQVRLSGFGLGKILGRSPDTVVVQKSAAPGYKAPEQLRGEAVTPKADVYGLGLLVWSLFTGQTPSEKGIRPPRLTTLRSDLLKAVCTAVDAALETSVDKRPATCRDLELALGLVPGLDNGRDELCEKLELLRDSRPNPDSAARPSVPVSLRPRIPLQSIRPSEPAISSKDRLSTVPPAPVQSLRPMGSLPPILFDDVQPKSVYPLLKALAEKIPKADAAGIPKAPRLPQVESIPASSRGAPSERVPKSGVPKPAVPTPLELDPAGPKPRTEWMASVPDEEAFDKLFEEATSRSPEELEAAGIGTNVAGNQPDTAQKSRRRFEYADTVRMDALKPSAELNADTAPSAPLATPPLGPPPTAKPVRFGPRPDAPAPPKLKRGFAPPPVPPGQEKRPPVLMLAVVFGLVAIGFALVVMALSDKPSETPKLASSASASGSGSASMRAPAPIATNAPTNTGKSAPGATGTSAAITADSPAPPLPYGQGYLIVAYPEEATVYVSGRKLGQTNTRLQNRCGRYFVRIAKKGDGPYPEWLSAGQPVAIPCQDSIRVEIPR